MAQSSITKLSGIAPGSLFAITLGATVREHRKLSGLTQEELASPATKAFISLVERGRMIPSLASLYLIAARLGIPAWEILDEVNVQMTRRVD
jgi:transcriptional regulator with XRE-family HTH domain